MRKRCSTLIAVFCMLLVSVMMVFKAEARAIQTDNDHIYRLDSDTLKASLRLGTAFLTGEANEIVNAGSYSENYLSRLKWDIDELFMAGIGFSTQRRWVAVHGDFWMNVTEGSGEMDDFDWVEDGPGWSDWSHHDDTDVEAAVFDINCEFFIPRLSIDHFVLSLFLGYRYENFEWEAKGGSYVYSSHGFRDVTGTFPSNLLAVSYEQEYKSPYLGVGLRGNLDRFELSARLIGSPIVSGKTTDLHHMRNLKIEADMDDGTMFSLDITGSYSFTNKLALALSYTYITYDDLKGNSTYFEVDEDSHLVSKTYVDATSMDLTASMVSLVLVYSF